MRIYNVKIFSFEREQSSTYWQRQKRFDTEMDIKLKYYRILTVTTCTSIACLGWHLNICQVHLAPFRPR